VAPEQALLQHTPSVQKPLWHWLVAVHAAPLTLRPQVSAPAIVTQVLGARQSWACVATVHVVLHAPATQAKLPQSWSLGVMQAPLPSQVAAGVTEDVLAQMDGLQLAVEYEQAPFRQFPVVPQLLDGVATHLRCGSGALSATARQSPRVAVRLQAMHASVHPLLQHTPWAQKPDLHSVPALQSCPEDLRPQEEDEDVIVQTFPDAHWMLLLVQLP
jgi:hypothetical protein